MYQDIETHGQGGFLTGLLFGAAVGAALGVVLAPRSGRDTRNQLAQTGERLREKVSQTYTKASEGVSSMIARGNQAVEQGREAFERTRPGSETPGTTFGSGASASNPLTPDYPSSRGM